MASFGEVPSRNIKEMSIRNKSESIRQSFLSGFADHEETFDHLCAQCFDDKHHVEAAGCCVSCEDLLCNRCIQQHTKSRALKSHVIVKFECAQCLDANLTVIATGFCTNCDDYLCNECIRLHKKIRAIKKHNILEGEEMPLLPVDHNVPKLDTKTTPKSEGDDSVPGRIDAAMPSLYIASESAESNFRAERQALYKVKSPNESKVCWISSSVVMPTGEIILSDNHNNNIKLFDKHFNECSKLNTESYPHDMCLSNKSSKDIYVSLPDKKSILCVEVEAGNLTEADLLCVEGECYGITCWTKGIAVTSWHVDDGSWTLQLLDYEGHIVKQIQPTTNLEFHWPEYLTSIMNGKQIILSDSNASSVTSVDTATLRVVFVYRNENLEWPLSVTTDTQDNIYVAGHWSHNVHVISKDGEHLAIILSQQDGFHYPTGICYNKITDTITVQPSKDKSEIVTFRVHGT